MSVTHSPAPPILTLDSARVEDVMHRGVVSCPSEMALEAVARTMASHRVHCVIGLGDVTEDDTRMWGVISDRDIVAAAATESGYRTAGGSACTEALTIGPERSVRQAAEVMAEHGVTHLVVTSGDKPVGVVSTLDVAAVMGGLASLPPATDPSLVSGLMTTPVFTVGPETPLVEVAALLVTRRISGVPVVRGDEVVGVVSESDVVPTGSPTTRGRLSRLLGPAERPPSPSASRTAQSVMSSHPITIGPSEEAATAARVMTEHDVARLPVVAAGRVVGILSRSDLLRGYARTAGGGRRSTEPPAETASIRSSP